MADRKDPRYNASGCRDLVAYEAIKNADKESRDKNRVNRLMVTIFYICDLAGFSVEGRVTLKDKKTGKIWR